MNLLFYDIGTDPFFMKIFLLKTFLPIGIHHKGFAISCCVVSEYANDIKYVHTWIESD